MKFNQAPVNGGSNYDSLQVLALRVGYRALCSDVRAAENLTDAPRWILDSLMVSIAGPRTALWGYPCAVSDQLRTAADKGNPTVELKLSIAMASEGADAM